VRRLTYGYLPNRTAAPPLDPWAFAHRGKWGQLTPLKMDEKLKSENTQKSSFLDEGGGEVIRVMTGWSS